MSRIVFLAGVVVLLSLSTATATQIQGEYLEARTCDVYTGPCFANAEWGLAGKEALLAWKVETGSWNEIELAGLGVALVLQAERTLANDGIFRMDAGDIESLILVDEKADREQRGALVAFVKDSARELTRNVVSVVAAPIDLRNDHISGEARFTAGDFAAIETRGLRKTDCTCTNEVVYYQPLTKVRDASPAYTRSVRFAGREMNSTYDMRGLRSAFLATFRR